ncbi:class III signal peptide-containing protein [Methanococcus voltae]|uniref:Uncharacterized protein n=2 Tax=Methanococcus voltae TaxID=2188 RepID=A0A8J7RFY7_METVO|nr:class III signal peptide-containing protein [Methanococcus voltae]MBP2172449.1 hypothetical protein [Methanococcus voltae]MBP2201644.1 hypothetical protein [Methanococcus voltae]MCS3922432.1 hypothetical protein [Methanococcus voltae PS]
MLKLKNRKKGQVSLELGIFIALVLAVSAIVGIGYINGIKNVGDAYAKPLDELDFDPKSYIPKPNITLEDALNNTNLTEIQKTLESNKDALIDEINKSGILSGSELIYSKNNAGSNNSWSRILENHLENLSKPPYDNMLGISNPSYPNNKGILNWNAVGNLPAIFQNPAVFITNNAKYSYDNVDTADDLEKLKGTVIIYKPDVSKIMEYYYIDENLKKSKKETYRIK